MRGAIGFVVCGFVIAITREIFHPASLLPFGAYILGGAIGAVALTRTPENTIRHMVCFGLGFFLTGILIAFTEFDTIGSDYGTAISGFVIAFALGGGIGGLSFGPRLILIGALTFGFAGGVFGYLWILWKTFGVGLILFSLNYIKVVLIVFPFLLGGTLFGAAVGFTQRNNFNGPTINGTRIGKRCVLISGLFLLPILLVAILPWIGPREFYGKVINVINGDSLVVKRFWTPVQIRIDDVDCPEPGQPYGSEAMEFTSSRVMGKYVAVKAREKDEFGHLVADVIILKDRLNLGMELVSNGLARCENKNSISRKLKAVEQGAQKSRKGIWSQIQPESP